MGSTYNPCSKYRQTVNGPGPHRIDHGFDQEAVVTVYDADVMESCHAEIVSHNGFAEVRIGAYVWGGPGHPIGPFLAAGADERRYVVVAVGVASAAPSSAPLTQ